MPKKFIPLNSLGTQQREKRIYAKTEPIAPYTDNLRFIDSQQCSRMAPCATNEKYFSKQGNNCVPPNENILSESKSDQKSGAFEELVNISCSIFILGGLTVFLHNSTPSSLGFLFGG
ncbi:hypothetical protein CEXT_203921 [Caerostris extrusa]|uniref:Uncharacterized protein n=1 Tax=Caerostris extrusa TaxID=172846 RepID=A0AAV4MWB1_CAEEX|nr:hypothetical protein CEXT_203921 [Caerostris extrusa]